MVKTFPKYATGAGKTNLPADSLKSAAVKREPQNTAQAVAKTLAPPWFAAIDFQSVRPTFPFRGSAVKRSSFPYLQSRASLQPNPEV